MDDQEWANQSLRRALQNIQDAATKPLHEEIERLRAEKMEWANIALDRKNEIERLRGLLRETKDPLDAFANMAGLFQALNDRDAVRALLSRIDAALGTTVQPAAGVSELENFKLLATRAMGLAMVSCGLTQAVRDAFNNLLTNYPPYDDGSADSAADDQ